jgi:hypothetical protein
LICYPRFQWKGVHEQGLPWPWPSLQVCTNSKWQEVHMISRAVVLKFFAYSTLKLCNIIAGIPDNKMDGSSEKLKKK